MDTSSTLSTSASTITTTTPNLSKYNNTKWYKLANDGLVNCPISFKSHYNQLVDSFIEYIDILDSNNNSNNFQDKHEQENEQPLKKHKNNYIAAASQQQISLPIEELIGSFNNISLMVPKVNCRKFYIYTTYLRLELKSNNIDILYNNIKRILILPLEKSFFSIAITLTNYINMGKAVYENIVFSLKPNEKYIYILFFYLIITLG